MLNTISKAEWRAIKRANKLFNATDDQVELVYDSIEERRNRREDISSRINCSSDQELTTNSVEVK